MPKTFRLSGVLLALGLAACSAGGASNTLTTMPADNGVKKVAVVFHIVIPPAPGIHPAYVSSGTQSASVSVNGGTPVIFACTTSCSGSILAPLGNDTFAISLYSAANAGGSLLSTGSITQSIASGVANRVDVSLNGVIASIVVTSTPAFTAGSTSSAPVAVSAKDAAGYTIVGTYTVPITLTNSDTTGATSLSVTTVTTSTTSVNLNYNGSGGFAGTTITAKAGTISGFASIQGVKAGCLSTHAATAPPGLYPCDLQNAYSIASGTSGAGMTVAIVDAYDDPNAEADLTKYRSTFNLPACTTANGCFSKVNQTGGTSYPTGDANWAGEISLDLDTVSAICPNCHILLVEATSNSNANLLAAIDEAVALHASVISDSWGGPEFSTETTGDAHLHLTGIPITFSTGDNDYQAGPSWPATSPYVTAVGGTSLQADSSPRGWTEAAWNDYPTWVTTDTGAQSGCSAYETKPAFQHDTGCTTRMTADVSAVADPYAGGIAVYDSYATTSSWQVIGGTSLSAPIIAAMYALSGNTSTVSDASYPYLHASQFNDITAGNTLGPTGVGTSLACAGATLYFCTAGAGYDGPTGIGTPNGTGGLQPMSAIGIRAQVPQRSANVAARMQALQGHAVQHVCPAAIAGATATCYALRIVL